MEEKINDAIRIAKGRMLAFTIYAEIQKGAQALVNLMMAKAQYAALREAIGKPSEELDKELTFVLGRVRANLGATDLQQVTQAVLHLTHAKSMAEQMQDGSNQTAKTTKPK